MNNQSLQRQPDAEEEEKESIQAKAAGPLADSFEADDNVKTQVVRAKGAADPLPDPVRAYMEPRFGVDFSQVRVYTGSDATKMNRDIGAQAFTHGADVYFGEGRSPSNLELTAHELTHVIQQTGGASLVTKRLEQASSSNTASSSQQIGAARGAAKIEQKEPDSIASQGVSINDDKGLGRAASVMGVKVLERKQAEVATAIPVHQRSLTAQRLESSEHKSWATRPRRLRKDKLGASSWRRITSYRSATSLLWQVTTLLMSNR